jgi:hypothetical protein
MEKAMRAVNMPTFIAKSTLWCALMCSVVAIYAKDLADIAMPESVTVNGRVLVLNGRGVATKVSIRVYLIGLYLEKKTTDAPAAIASDEAKRVVLIMVRDVSRQQFIKALERGMLRNSGSAMPRLRTRLDLLENAMPDLRKENVLDFTYLPGTGTVLHCEGQELKIPGKDFADALLSIWLGSNVMNRNLRHDLLKG